MALEFKDRFIGKVMSGKIDGIKLPKPYEKFTKKEKQALINLNPNNKDFYFKKELSEQPKEDIQAEEQAQQEEE